MPDYDGWYRPEHAPETCKLKRPSVRRWKLLTGLLLVLLASVSVYAVTNVLWTTTINVTGTQLGLELHDPDTGEVVNVIDYSYNILAGSFKETKVYHLYNTGEEYFDIHAECVVPAGWKFRIRTTDADPPWQEGDSTWSLGSLAPGAYVTVYFAFYNINSSGPAAFIVNFGTA